jgi:hypothetical protein
MRFSRQQQAIPLIPDRRPESSVLECGPMPSERSGSSGRDALRTQRIRRQSTLAWRPVDRAAKEAPPTPTPRNTHSRVSPAPTTPPLFAHACARGTDSGRRARTTPAPRLPQQAAGGRAGGGGGGGPAGEGHRRAGRPAEVAAAQPCHRTGQAVRDPLVASR